MPPLSRSLQLIHWAVIVLLLTGLLHTQLRVKAEVIRLRQLIERVVLPSVVYEEDGALGLEHTWERVPMEQKGAQN